VKTSGKREMKAHIHLSVTSKTHFADKNKPAKSERRSSSCILRLATHIFSRLQLNMIAKAETSTSI